MTVQSHASAETSIDELSEKLNTGPAVTAWMKRWVSVPAKDAWGHSQLCAGCDFTVKTHPTSGTTLSVLIALPDFRFLFLCLRQGCLFYRVVLWNPSTLSTTSRVQGLVRRHGNRVTGGVVRLFDANSWVWRGGMRGGRGRGGRVGGRGARRPPRSRTSFVCLSFNNRPFLTHQWCYTTGS